MLIKEKTQWRILPAVALILALLPSGAAAQAITETRDIYKEYISIRKLIGEERSAWETQKLTLRDMAEVIRAEIDQTRETIARLEESASSADLRRRELMERLEEAKAASAGFSSDIAAYETLIKGIITKLPDPLLREVAPLLGRLPDDPDNSRLAYSQRIQTVVGLLTQIDKFNSDLRSVSEVKSLADGSQEVQTLYFGLAGALFTNASGTHAGYGMPAETGWEWTTVEGENAEAILRAVDIYAARRAPAFVSVPLALEQDFTPSASR